jgi:riboflavin kinase/FMN adenylyltransferase
MQYFTGLENLPAPPTPHTVIEGAFDGVHCGHQALLHAALEAARETGTQSAVLTFEPTPAEVFRRLPRADLRLTTAEERREILESLGVDLVVVADFNLALQATTPDQFVRDILLRRLDARVVVASETHTFGHRQTGNIYTLTHLGCELGFEVRVLPLSATEGRSVSSTRIRELLWTGEVEAANQLFCRDYTCRGPVITGQGRGTGLGFPTANLSVPLPKLLPAEGVYAGWAVREADRTQRWAAAIIIGSSPTFLPGEDARRVEVHLLDFSGDLLGQELIVGFTRRLREQRPFANQSDLTAQIARDLEEIRQSSI